MPDTYKDFAREPSKAHQCMHHFEETGLRCRSKAMHNEFMCYHHRTDDIQTVIENDPFLIASLDDHDAIQQALADVAARLACNHMDFKRATLLLQNLQIASANLIARNQLIQKAGGVPATVVPPSAVETLCEPSPTPQPETAYQPQAAADPGAVAESQAVTESNAAASLTEPIDETDALIDRESLILPTIQAVAVAPRLPPTCPRFSGSHATPP